ncbi:MAG TPA: glycosyltransferase family 4 protein [Solirubrobacteraceae bacterium]
MRILLVNDWVAGEGGVERWLLDARGLLEEAGHDVRLLVSSAGTAADGDAEYVARAARSPVAQLPLQVANPAAIVTARRAVRSFRPDVALVAMFEMHLSPAAVLALGDVPVAGVVMYYKPVCPNGRKLWPDGTLCSVRAGAVCVRTGCVPAWLAPREAARYALIARALRRMTAVATCSRWMAAKLAANGVDATPLHLAVAPPAPGHRREAAPEPTFVYAGRLAPEKGLDDLLDAFASVRHSHPKATLRIVGGGPEGARLRARATEGVTFTGRVEREAVATQWRDAWAAVVPSRWAEPYGMVAAEAIAHGVPVIASATGGLAEIVEDGRTGALFPNGDAVALRDRMRSVADATAPAFDDDAAKELMRRHAPRRHAEELEELLRRAGG